jgi:hypothetical protein
MKKRGLKKKRKTYIVRICGSESGREHKQRKREDLIKREIKI